MYYPPDIENLRNRKDEKYVSIRDIVESSHFDSNEYRIPFALGMENGEPRVLDVSRASPIFIGEQGGSPHTEVLWNFIALTALTRSPEEVKLILIDPLGVDLKFAEALPHTLLRAHEPHETIGALTLLEEEILERENTEKDGVPIVVVTSNISMAYSVAPKLQRQALKALFERGSKVGVFSLSTLGLDQSLFCRDFAVQRTRLPNKIILETYERDIIGLIEEAIYRNRKIKDKSQKEKYIAKVAEAKVRLEKYQAEKEMQSCRILPNFFETLKILAEHKKISTALVQRKLMIGYGEAAKIIDSLLALSIIKKKENHGYYILNTNEERFSEIVDAYTRDIYYNGWVNEADNEYTSAWDPAMFRSKEQCIEYVKASYPGFEKPVYVISKIKIGGNDGWELIEKEVIKGYEEND